MKKLGIIVIVLVGLTLMGSVVGDYYRYDLYQAAMEFESSKAHLVERRVNLGNESYAILEGPSQAGQEAVFMLHGFSANKYNWLRFSAYLSDRYHLVAPDLLGHGDNPTDLNRSYSIVEQVKFVRQLASTLGIERFHIVGNSMGGAIASLYAATYPDQILSVTLISPAGVHDIPSEMDKLLEQGSNPLIATSIEGFGQVIDFVMEDKPYIPGPVAKVEAEKSVARVEINRKIFADLRKDLELGLDDRFKQIKAPTLIIWGDQDRAINVKNIDKYASLIPNATKAVYPGIGHLAMIEVPERAATEMLDFIASH